MRHLLYPFGLRPKTAETGPRYADTNDRSMAGAIDLVLVYFLLSGVSNAITTHVFAYFNVSPSGYDRSVQSFQGLLKLFWEVRYPWLIANSIIVLLIGVALVSCQVAWGTTPGKWLLGLRVVRAETHEPLKPWRYVLRFLAYIPSCLPLMLGFFWMSFNKQRRGWHDYIAGTEVLNIRPRGWYWLQVKKGFRRLRGLPPLEQTVSQPAAEQSDKNSKNTIQ